MFSVHWELIQPESNSLFVWTYLANKADSDSDSDSDSDF